MNELLKRIENLERENRDFKTFIESLKSAEKIPLGIDQAFRNRFLNPLAQQSVKSATSENRTVNEGGVSSYDVLKAPDGFDRRFDKETGSYKYYPWFNQT